MSQTTDIAEAIKRLELDNARLRGEALATGIILAQLLQSTARKELNPHGFVSKITRHAREAIERFQDPDVERLKTVKESANEIVQSYEDQIRSILPI